MASASDADNDDYDECETTIGPTSSCVSICEIVEIRDMKRQTDLVDKQTMTTTKEQQVISRHRIEVEEYESEDKDDNDMSFNLIRLKDVLVQRKTSMIDLSQVPPPTIDQIMSKAKEKQKRMKNMRKKRHISATDITISEMVMNGSNLQQPLLNGSGNMPDSSVNRRKSLPQQTSFKLESSASFAQYCGKVLSSSTAAATTTTTAAERKERRRSLTKPLILDKNQFISRYSRGSQQPLSVSLSSRLLEHAPSSLSISKLGSLNAAFESELAQLEDLANEKSSEDHDRKCDELSQSIINAAGLLALAKEQIKKSNEDNATMKCRSLRLESLLEDALESNSDERIEKEELKANYNRLNEHLQGMRRKFLSAVIAHSQRRLLQEENMELRKELSRMRKKLAFYEAKSKKKCCYIV